MVTPVDENLEVQLSKQRTSILKVYNLYRIFFSFSLLYLFLEFEELEFGSVNPEFFQTTILAYIGANIVATLLTLFTSVLSGPIYRVA